MAESNGDWGFLAAHDSEMGEAWDGFSRLPEAGVNPILDSFVARKNITIEALMRLGARVSSESGALVFAFDGGIKFRDMVTGRRWSYLGSEWRHMKIIPAAEPSDTVIVTEGETDAARLTILYPEADVAIMPAGALHFSEAYAVQLSSYDRVLVGLDTDTAGEQGAEKVLAALPTAVRFPPPANDSHDWCGAEVAEGWPSLHDYWPTATPVLQVLVPAGELLQLEVPEITSWYDGAVLPVGGFAMLHGWAKSFKSFIAFDMLARLSQGLDWCTFEPTEEPCRTAIIQFEIPWAFYRERVAALAATAIDAQLFNENFYTFSPLTRPQLTAGNTKREDEILSDLVGAGIQVLLIDPVRRATGAIDMNAEGEVRKMLSFIERVNDQGITVVATHHDNKDGARGGGGSPLAMTGSGAWAGDPDTIVSVELPKGEKLATSVCRNLVFTLRNAPAPAPKGMRMQDNGVPMYSSEPFGDGFTGDDGDGQDVPSI